MSVMCQFCELIGERPLSESKHTNSFVTYDNLFEYLQHILQ